MNNIIKLLILSDIFVITGFGLIEPILAIFIKDSLIGGTIFAAGFASTLFIITKSLTQLPFSRFVDRHRHKVRFLIAGTLIFSIVPFIYIFAKHINHIYLAEIIYGIGSGLAFPTWLSLWSINIDRKHAGFEWSLYNTLVGVGTAISGAIGAIIAQLLGFRVTFLIVGLMSLVGCAILFFLEEKSKRAQKTVYPYYFRRQVF